MQNRGAFRFADGRFWFNFIVEQMNEVKGKRSDDNKRFNTAYSPDAGFLMDKYSTSATSRVSAWHLGI